MTALAEQKVDGQGLACIGLAKTACDRLAASREKFTRMVAAGAQKKGGTVPTTDPLKDPPRP